MGLFSQAAKMASDAADNLLGGSANKPKNEVTNLSPPSIANSNQGRAVGEPQSDMWATNDRRVMIKPFSQNKQAIIGGPVESNIMYTLYRTNGVVFPYTPSIMYSIESNWNTYELTHTNVQAKTFNQTDISDITISGLFTATTPLEAQYKLACLHFFRTVTKMYYGVSGDNTGAPPPTLKFSAYGNLFNDIPVIVKSFSHDLNPEVDYVPVHVAGGVFDVPVKSNFNVVLGVQPNPIRQRDEFDLNKFRTGELLNNKGFM